VLSLSAVLFQYHEEHQYPILGQILKPVTDCVEPSAGLSGNVMQMISLESKNSGASFNIKMAIVISFPFYAFSLYAAIRRNTDPVYNESRLYLNPVHGLSLKDSV
jgi:hypothetical protein